jgi:hypothetical protein
MQTFDIRGRFACSSTQSQCALSVNGKRGIYNAQVKQVSYLALILHFGCAMASLPICLQAAALVIDRLKHGDRSLIHFFMAKAASAALSIVIQCPKGISHA